MREHTKFTLDGGEETVTFHYFQLFEDIILISLLQTNTAVLPCAFFPLTHSYIVVQCILTSCSK